MKPQYQGVLEQQASNSSGEVGWLWNKAQTSLYLTWVTTPTYNLTAGFAAAHDKLQTTTTNLTLVGAGNTTMSGHNWVYQTYSFKSNGAQGYLTIAEAYYQSSQRAYVLLFQDTSSSTLNALTHYGNKFSG